MIRILEVGSAFSRGVAGGCRAVSKVIIALSLIGFAAAANAVTVLLTTHNQTSGAGAISTLITDGSHVQGQPASTAVFDWDGSTLTSTGLYSAVGSLGSNPNAPTILNDQVTDLSISTATGMADAAAYVCVEGTFLAGVGANGCGGYTLGLNFFDESTTVWGPGLLVAQTIGGDDVSTGAPRTISAYDFGLDSITEMDGMTPSDGLTPTDQVKIGNGIPVGTPDGELLTFEVQTSADDDAANAAINVSTSIPVLVNDALTDNINALTTANFSNGGSATAVGVPGPRGSAAVNYTSAPGFSGVETFEYTVTDVNGPPVTATVAVTVTDQPVAVDDGAMGAPFAIVFAGDTVALDVLANDAGLGNTPLTVTAPVNATPALGAANVVGSPGDASAIRIDYTAGQSAGMDSFGYQIADSGANVAAATVFVEVQVNAVPVAVDDDGAVATTFTDESINIDVLANDTGLDDTPVTVTITSDPANGTIGALESCTPPAANCSVPYTPDPGFAGTDTFRYTVTDSTPDVSNEATVTVTVNTVPGAVDDTASTSSNASVSVDVLANDLRLDFPPFSVAAVPNAATKGSAAVQANRIVYSPSGGSERTDAIQYTVTDANGKSSTAWLRITIVPAQGGLAGASSSSALGPAAVAIVALLAMFRRRRD